MSSEVPSRLGVWDYVTFVVIIFLASCIGIYHAIRARKSKNTQDFLVRSHDLGLIPLILSSAATFLSAIGILGFPTESYTNGVIFMACCLCFFLLLPFGLFLYLPIYFNLGINSIYEYLEMRFNRCIRMCASIMLNLQVVLYTACVIYAPALALNQVTGLHLWASVASIGAICILYTSMGGIKAVVWADVTQMIVMFLVILVIVIKGTINLGGVSRIWQICTEGKRTDFFIFRQSENSFYTLWTIIIGGTIHYMAVVTNNQMFLQRYLCNRTLKEARLAYTGGCIAIAIVTFLNTVGGLIMYARYHDCDPLISGQVTSRDQMMALFAVETLSFCEGFPGIFVAAILCATLSTLSSSLNSLATVTIEDYIKPFKPSLRDNQAMRLAKIIAMLYGLLCIALVLLAQQVDGLIKTVFTIFAMTGAPVTAIFTMGMIFPWINSKGAMTGFIAALLFAGWGSIGSLVTQPVYPSAPIGITGCNMTNISNVFNTSSELYYDTNTTMIETPTAGPKELDNVLDLYTYSSLWYTLWGCALGSTVAIIASIITGIQNPEELDPKLLFPPVIQLCRSLPQKYQEILGFKPQTSTYLPISMTDPQNFNITEGHDLKSTSYSKIPTKTELEDELKKHEPQGAYLTMSDNKKHTNNVDLTQESKYS